MAATYKWKGIEGTKYTDGTIDALNREEAAYKLKEKKVIITSLEKVSGKEESEKVTSTPLISGKKVPMAEVIIFTKKLETMVRAGLPILQTIQMLEEQTTHPALKNIIKKIFENVESGVSLSDGFAMHPQVFDSIYVNLLRAGESSGKIDLFLDKLVTGMEKSQKIRASIKGALIYPAILLIVAIAVIVLMMVFVVPVFQKMFSGIEGGLPATTQAVVSISEFMRDPMGGGLLAIVLIGGGVLFSMAVKKSYKLRRSWHRMILQLPLFGPMIQKSALAKIAMIQGNLTAAGVSVLEALDIASTSTNNIVVREAMTDVKRGVYGGEPLSESFSKRPDVFTRTFSAMISVGENTGSMEEMYDSISIYYEEEVDTIIQRLTSMLEPIMIVFMGITIGFILIAMYTPMFQMGQVMK